MASIVFADRRSGCLPGGGQLGQGFLALIAFSDGRFWWVADGNPR
jgi:transposase